MPTTRAAMAVAAIFGCAGESPPARDATPVATSASAEPDAGAPPTRRVPYEAALECRKTRCYPPAKHCFDRCYKYNHAFNPEGHDRCDAACRHDYEVDVCERLCETEPLAFEHAPAGAKACQDELGVCRKDCAGHRMSCEAYCLPRFRACAGKQQ